MAQNKNSKSSKSNDKSGKSSKATHVAAAPEPETVETTEPSDDEVSNQLGELAAVPIRLIDATSFKNSRTGDFTLGDSKEDGSDQSFKELVESIEASGQKDPITVRHKRDGVATHGMPYEVIKGFRRFAAINLLAQRAGTEDSATINVIIKDLDDLQAIEENVFENTARDNLTAPDLAWAAFNLQERYKERGIAVSTVIIAKKMGKNQSHISRLLRIVTSAPVVSKAWQETRSPISIEAIERISKMDLDKQEEEYKRVNEVLAGTGRGRPQRPPIDAAVRQAERAATLLGNLESQGLITTSINWEANLGHLGVKTADLTALDIRKVGELAKAAFEKAKQPKTAAAAEAATQSSEAAATAAETTETAAN